MSSHPATPVTPAAQTASPPPTKSDRANVVKLGWVSLFNDAASEMLYPIMPLFITATLGATPLVLGIIDGCAEGVSSALRWIGGTLSDRFARRKPFVLIGYALSALSKPVMGLSAMVLGWPLFFVGRCADRMGKSVRNAARDALLAASADPAQRGRAFGFQRAMDTCGAVLGPLVTLAVLVYLAGYSKIFSQHGVYTQTPAWLKDIPLKWLYFFALIPGALAVACVAWVHEIRPRQGDPSKTGGKPPPIFQPFPRPMWQLALAGFVFSLGNSSDLFLIFRSSQLGLSLGAVVLVYVGYNMIYAAASQPLGRLSDKIGRKPLLIAGWAVYAIVYLGFAFARTSWAPLLLLGIYGFYQALTDGATGALIADVVPDAKRAGAVGLYNTATGLAVVIASFVAGDLIWHQHPTIAFSIGALCALAAIPLMALVKPPAQRHA